MFAITAGPGLSVDLRDFEAILFDLDGVVTDTAQAHAASWKKLFDSFLKRRAAETDEPFVPFNAERDYLRYVDGKPRYEGARSFLVSRGISLPFGDPTDSPGEETICALGNKKNDLFQEHLEANGVQAFPATIDLIHHARAEGVKTAIISSSKNCGPVLAAAGIDDLFDAKVDGADLVKLGLEGKPDPAVFLRAAEELHVEPDRAIVIEDAVAGVEAGREGHFGLVIGIDRRGEGRELLEHGADIVVHDLEELVVDRQTAFGNDRSEFGARQPMTDSLPLALDHFDEIASRLRGRKPVVFLDYDGTLTPIVERPEDAVLSDHMRISIQKLAEQCPVAIISGRDLPDVRSRVGLEEVFYAGSHGFDIEGPAGFEMRYEAGAEHLPMLDDVERELRDALDTIDGSQVERKRYSIAMHYRRVREEDVPKIATAVDDVLSRHHGLRRTHGKKVFDLQPAIDWHKGRAVEWLMNALKLDARESVPTYLGDDRTDEDAFAALAEISGSVSIIVADPSQPSRQTAAEFLLRDQKEVADFLERVAKTA